MKSRLVSVLNLGTMKYCSALTVQNNLVTRIHESMRSGGESESVLVMVEHPPVYTTGVRTKEYSVEEEQRLRGLGADFVRTNRGGLITFHGPGQLVVYPILNLRDFAPESTSRKSLLGMKWYINTLEQMVIDLIGEMGVRGSRSPHTGVWVGNNKICAMGVHNSNLVTSHGLALNCDTDMSWFSHIVPCGIQGAGVTSLSQELGTRVSVGTVTPRLVSQFCQTFNCDAEHISLNSETSNSLLA